MSHMVQVGGGRRFKSQGHIWFKVTYGSSRWWSTPECLSSPPSSSLNITSSADNPN